MTSAISSTSADNITPGAAHERSSETGALPFPTAMEMGTLHSQSPLSSLELIERDQQVRSNTQQSPLSQSDKKESSLSQPVASDRIQSSEPIKQLLNSSESQGQATSQALENVEVEKSKVYDSPLQVAGSPTDKYAVAKIGSPALPAINLILLLPTGARHNLHINENYLREQNVPIEARSIFSISVYTLKELILRDWHEGTCFLLPLISVKAYDFRPEN